MSNAYVELRDRHLTEIDAFPIKFAFNDQQFESGMRALGLEPTDKDKILLISDTGGFIRKSDEPAFDEMLERHERETAEAIAGDRTGDGYIFDMFEYELANHEYGYTKDVFTALAACGLTLDEVNAEPRLIHGLDKAIRCFKGREAARDDALDAAYEASRDIAQQKVEAPEKDKGAR